VTERSNSSEVVGRGMDGPVSGKLAVYYVDCVLKIVDNILS
jgi:hypothetical protein